ncbi:unnamed protein product [Darwinula stevensoni]|uniref:Uncharacterized protein n=1 Tax=Darwinula stevensoni TaxID=69355 RepID=A0A7R9A934_9CRUS|nr:unnamed protein product [Darwinula stevensoni]CAG0897010.1 unnamed protein product [Darwinula stevensoni]
MLTRTKAGTKTQRKYSRQIRKDNRLLTHLKSPKVLPSFTGVVCNVTESITTVTTTEWNEISTSPASEDTDPSATVTESTTTDGPLTLTECGPSPEDCKHEMTQIEGILEPCVNKSGQVPQYQKCLWNIMANSTDVIEFLLTPEDFGNFPNRSVQLRIGHGYKDEFPPGQEGTTVEKFEYPVDEDTTVTIGCDDAWVDMITREVIKPFRVFYTIKPNAVTATASWETNTSDTEPDSTATESWETNTSDTVSDSTTTEQTWTSPQKLCHSLEKICIQDVTETTGILELCVDYTGEVPRYQHCLWNILACPTGAIGILLTPDDFGNFPNETLLLRIGYGYKNGFPNRTDETVLAYYNYPVEKNTAVIVNSDVAWVDMMTLKDTKPFRAFYTIEGHAGVDCNSTTVTETTVTETDFSEMSSVSTSGNPGTSETDSSTSPTYEPSSFSETTTDESTSTPETTTDGSTFTPETTTDDSASTPETTTEDSSSTSETVTDGSTSTPETTTDDSSSTSETVTDGSTSTPETTTDDSSSTSETVTDGSTSTPETTTEDSSSTSETVTDGSTSTSETITTDESIGSSESTDISVTFPSGETTELFDCVDQGHMLIPSGASGLFLISIFLAIVFVG